MGGLGGLGGCGIIVREPDICNWLSGSRCKMPRQVGKGCLPGRFGPWGGRKLFLVKYGEIYGMRYFERVLFESLEAPDDEDGVGLFE